MKTYEANLDGLPGPTHHYGGLAQGNVASQQNAQSVSNPRKAALQGLDKMKLLHDLGLPQFILPPPPRPNPEFYNELVKDLAELSVLYSASTMWRANAAIVTPSADSGELNITPANLLSHRHRAQECRETQALLKTIFPKAVHHEPLPLDPRYADEGAANHMRLTTSHAAPGVNLFVYGRDMENPQANQPVHYTPRQTRQSLEMIAAVHKLPLSRTIFLQQHPDAVDAGVFHNDVIAMSNETLLIVHEKAYVRQAETLAPLGTLLPELITVEVKESGIPLPLAVKSYLFNSQLITLPDKSMLLIAPAESEENASVKDWIDRLIASDQNPVNEVRYLNLRESMKNGGGPACLRLRVVLTEEELAAADPRYRYSPDLHRKLVTIIEKTYRDKLILSDLAAPAFAQEAWAAQKRILEAFE